MSQRVCVIGLDGAEPSLAFDTWRDQLPTLGRLMRNGTFGRLESITPCITVPAWASMMSGKDPGQLGVYGFRNRSSHGYDALSTATSASISAPRVWDRVGSMGGESVVIGVPPAYPPRPVQGVSVGCFLTPSTRHPFTYPPEVAGEIQQVAGDYLVDVKNFRASDRQEVLRQIHDMTERRFAVIRHFLTTRSWQFFMAAEIGVDRMHHAFWKYHDPLHPKHEPGSPFKDAIFEYYRTVDRLLGDVLSCLDGDTIVWVVSDHGAKRLDGGICVNEWLILQGYLRLRRQPVSVTALEECDIDWEHTLAWASGGYYGRIFLNVQGREPQGALHPSEYQTFRTRLAAELEAIPDASGHPLQTRAFRPEELYRQQRGLPPDLLVYFGDLHWRAIGSVGHGTVHIDENDTGPDDANHAQQGLFVCLDPHRAGSGEVTGTRLVDVGPTILHQLGAPAFADTAGQVASFAL